MSGKEFLKNAFTSFFIIVTLVNAAIFFLGSALRPEQQFGYEAFLYPLIYGALSIIPVGIMYSRKELTVKQLFIRKGLQLISILAILCSAVFGIDGLRREPLSQILVFCFSIVVVFILVNVIMGIINANEAKELNDMLRDYQK